MKQEIRYCEECGKDTVHIRNNMNFWLHFILIICTGFLWLIPMVFYKAYLNISGKCKWRCEKCMNESVTKTLPKK